MNLNKFPPVLLDDAYLYCNLAETEQLDAGLISNLFSTEDVSTLPIFSAKERPVFRLFDLSILEILRTKGLDKHPVILSHLLDLEEGDIPEWHGGIAIEVANKSGIIKANHFKCDLLIGRSFEVPGPSRECSALVLFNLLSEHASHPFYLHGRTGYELFQSYLASGVSGVVLSPDQFHEEPGGEVFRFPLAGGASLRLLVKGGAPEAIDIRSRCLQDSQAFLRTSHSDGL
ncbi:hypothetical protein [Solemya velum gill symbiont]|nr:hypothetical protein [Solemya velum gill symbiont]OOY52046.1 hypothetical protein BOV97_06645 [Solemya velum gill symbiont]OOY56147.1 hypothetical protein BOV99_05645 [Solemya velum gill symbiont]OOY57390.1 hypothetical protein BOW00_05445 [Solemya velum gill symbiont]OOY60273.1 hypothetical protein BOW02_06000 [Solemya velum gill symbiont]OOY62424.1 hypothetical protein BOW04_06365 [Solemya velum gill symbiont]